MRKNTHPHEYTFMCVCTWMRLRSRVIMYRHGLTNFYCCFGYCETIKHFVSNINIRNVV